MLFIMLMKYKIILFCLICFLFAGRLAAEDVYNLYPDAQQKGYTFSTADGKFKVGILGNSLSKRDKVVVILKEIKQQRVVLPDDENLISAIYSVYLYDNKRVRVKKPLWISIAYETDNGGTKNIKLWKKNKQKWKTLDSNDKSEEKVIRTSIKRTKAIFAVFQEDGDYEIGLASWYDWDGAAHRTYPFGTIVKVTNLANNKSCEATINDRGPFIEGRIIDLPREAFAAIADLGAGIVEVKVEPIHIP